jgi:SWIM zinc finger
MDLTAGMKTYEVESESHAALIYLVRLHRDRRWSCSCPHWQWRLSKGGGLCKHIRRVLAEESQP